MATLGREDPLDRGDLHARAAGARCSPSPGRYTARGWTEWTQGFQYGSAILQFDATGDEEFLEIGRDEHGRAAWRRT